MVETARQIDPAKTPRAGARRHGREVTRAEDSAPDGDAGRARQDPPLHRGEEDLHAAGEPEPDRRRDAGLQPQLVVRQHGLARRVREERERGLLQRHARSTRAWTRSKKAEHLGFYNPWQLEIVSIHEAFPGHYYQFLHLKKSPSLVRQLMGTGSNSEGWAHYCEEMAIEEGFGGGDPRYTMAMLNLALQRIGRYIVGIEMHVNGWTMEQGTDVLREGVLHGPRQRRAGGASRHVGSDVPRLFARQVGDPADLRADVKRAQGDRFVLGDFHDRILEMGRLPLPLMRHGVPGR